MAGGQGAHHTIPEQGTMDHGGALLKLSIKSI